MRKPNGISSLFHVILKCNSPFSEFYSHKAVRQLQNQRAYQIRRATKNKSLVIPKLPAKLIELAARPLPVTYTFRQAACSADSFSDTDYDDAQLQKFDRIPPYPSRLPSHDQARLLDALHGFRLRQQRDYEDARLQRYNTQPADVFMHEVHTELSSYLKKWELCGVALEEMDPDAEGYTFDLMLAWDMQQWIARRSHSLYIDLEALQKGSDKILCEYVNRWS
jgi:hypothetical protein